MASKPSAIRRLLVAAGCAASIPAYLRARATPKRVAWIVRSDDDPKRIRELFKARGLVEGRDLVLTFEKFAGRDPRDEAKLVAQADRLATARFDVIVMEAHALLHVIQDWAGGTTPVVAYNLGTDPVEAGAVESFRRPGGNITGTTIGFDEITPKIWEMLKELSPSLERAGQLLRKDLADLKRADHALADAGKEPTDRFTTMDRLAAARLGIEMVFIGIPPGATRQAVEAEVARARVQGLYVGMAGGTVKEFLETCRLPTVASTLWLVRNGVLAGVVWDLKEGETYAVAIVERILGGERPATIPVYRMNKWRVAVNLGAARRAGIEIPASLRLRADEVYE